MRKYNRKKVIVAEAKETTEVKETKSTRSSLLKGKKEEEKPKEVEPELVKYDSKTFKSSRTRGGRGIKEETKEESKPETKEEPVKSLRGERTISSMPETDKANTSSHILRSKVVPKKGDNNDKNDKNNSGNNKSKVREFERRVEMKPTERKEKSYGN